MFNQQAQQRERSARVRGWIIYFLYKGRPQPLPLYSVWKMLDRHNMPLTRRRFAEEIDYLRGLRLLSVFPAGSDTEVSVVEQAKLTQRYADCESDQEMGLVLWARLTTAGVNFQDGTSDHEGITRVE
jgi:hypothetical protein